MQTCLSTVWRSEDLWSQRSEPRGQAWRKVRSVTVCSIKHQRTQIQILYYRKSIPYPGSVNTGGWTSATTSKSIQSERQNLRQFAARRKRKFPELIPSTPTWLCLLGRWHVLLCPLHPPRKPSVAASGSEYGTKLRNHPEAQSLG